MIEHGVDPCNEMPLWLPETSNGIFRMDITRTLDAGLTFRPLARTVEDTLSWITTLPADWPYEANLMGRHIEMAPEREAVLLQRWHEQPS